MCKTDALKMRRDEILEEIKSLEQMRRGSVVEQVYESVGKDGEKVRRGPYLLYSFKEKGKTVSRRIKYPRAKQRTNLLGNLGAFSRGKRYSQSALRWRFCLWPNQDA